MKKFKALKCLSVLFGIFTLIGLFGLYASINQDIIISIRSIIVEKCQALGIQTVAEAQSYVIIVTAASFFISSIFALSAFGTASKRFNKASFKRQESEVHVNTEKEIQIMKRRELNALREQRKAEAKEAKKEKEVKVEPVKEEEKVVETVKEEVQPKTTSDKKIDDILNSI